MKCLYWFIALSLVEFLKFVQCFTLQYKSFIFDVDNQHVQFSISINSIKRMFKSKLAFIKNSLIEPFYEQTISVVCLCSSHAHFNYIFITPYTNSNHTYLILPLTIEGVKRVTTPSTQQLFYILSYYNQIYAIMKIFNEDASNV